MAQDWILLKMVAVHSNVSDVILLSNIFLYIAEKKAIKSGLRLEWMFQVWKGFQDYKLLLMIQWGTFGSFCFPARKD